MKLEKPIKIHHFTSPFSAATEALIDRTRKELLASDFAKTYSNGYKNRSVDGILSPLQMSLDKL